jgi:Uma2 family endonuclease
MTSMTTTTPTAGWLPWGRALTADDLAAAPDDGHRYELIDGVLLVSPSPVRRHQAAVVELVVLLRSACPPELQVLVAPFDVRLAADTVIQPDVVVARREDLTDRDLPAAPVLAVEVLSPSTRRVDLLLKHERLARAGCPSYWVVDPADEGRLVAWELRDGAYAQVADVTGATAWTAVVPYAVTVAPTDLVS